MFSIRAIARSAPRSASRLATSTLRSSARPVALKASWKPAAQHIASAFSTAARALVKEGTVDEELVAKLESELEIEQDMKEADDTPVSVTDFLENGPWEISDIPGKEEVTLTRKFGDET
jgi:complement component 1 Q subcomponent-binding protein